MSSLQLRMYWKSPFFVKNWLASIHSWRLDHQRHGLEFQCILDEIAIHDKWSTKQLLDYQQQQLTHLIHHAATKVPYYRKIFSERGLDPKTFTSLADLRKIPILEKEVIRKDPKSLLSEGLDIKKLLCMHTSGTTGTPLDIYCDVWLNSAIFAYNEVRCHAVAGMMRRRNPSISICGELVTAHDRTKPPFWVYNKRWKQLYMSTFHLSQCYLPYYINEIQKFKADYIEGYPSSVYAVAQYIVENNIKPIPLKACFTTAETLFDYQRDAIKKAFGCKTYNQYGCTEQAIFAAECEKGTMHLTPEIGFVEVVDDNDNPVKPGETGHLICTNLLNKVQPLIRYRIGDMGSLGTGQCPCGRHLPILKSFEGRAGDVFILRDGRQICQTCLSGAFYGVKGLIAAQMIQDDYNRFRVRIIPGKDYEDTGGQKILSILTQRMGDIKIKLELVESIERTAAGKLKTMICNLPNKKR